MTGGSIGGRGRQDDSFEAGSLEGMDDQDVADLWIRDPDTGAFRMRTPADGSPAVPPQAPRRGRSPVDRASARGSGRSAAADDGEDVPLAQGARSRDGSGRGTAGRTGSREAVPGPRRRRGEPGPGRGSGSGSGKGKKPGKAVRRIRNTLIGLVVVCAVVVGGGCGYYYYLNSRIASTEKDAGDNLPKAAADEFGRRPLNVLLIGNDSRIGEGAKYGAKGHEGLADVGILMHISADRSNATFVSIPRDTVVQIPACKVDGRQHPATVGSFNTSYQYGGAPCTVSTVQRMLGIEIDHYIMVKFKGVRDLVNAVGGVEICTEKGINDPVRPNQQGGTGLNIPPGTVNLDGEQALGFLRTRHADGSDGSDLSRVEQQKLFMMSLMQELKSSARFSNIDGMLKIAQIATGAIQVDHGLQDLKKLASLGQQLQKVPAKRMVFTTLPYEEYPADKARIQPKQPEANRLWEAIRKDQPLTKGDGTASPQASATGVPAPTTDPSTIRVVVDNTTKIANKATNVAAHLRTAKFQASVSTTKLSTTTLAQSVVRFPAGHEDAARAVARAVGLPDTAIEQRTGSGTQLQLLIGTDFPASMPSAAAPGPAPQATDQALRAQTADQDLCKVKTKRYT